MEIGEEIQKIEHLREGLKCSWRFTRAVEVEIMSGYSIDQETTCESSDVRLAMKPIDRERYESAVVREF